MKKIIILTSIVVSVFLSNTILLAAQDPFEEVFTKIATEIASSDIKKAFKMADSLLAHSTNDFQKMKSKMLLADLNLRSGNIAKSLALATQAEELAEKEGNKVWLARIAGFLSSLYQNADLNIQARKYLSIAEKINNDLEPSPRTKVVLALVHQQKAYFAVYEDKNSEVALKELALADKYNAELPPKTSGPVFSALNYQLYGLSYANTKNYDTAEVYYQKALKELGDTESELKGFVYCGLGDIFIKKGQTEQAGEYYKKAEVYAKSSNNLNAKIIINKSLAAYYETIGDTNTALKHQQLYTELLNTQAKTAKAISTELITELNKKEKNNGKIFNILISVLVVLVIAIVILLYIGSLNRKKNRARYKQLLSDLEAPANSDTQHIELAESETNEKKGQQQRIMTKESEERLLQGLQDLESKDFFLQGDVSLSVVASKLNTNTKYLSFIINEYKKKDFNNYVNELRVAYAIKDLRANPQSRKYKISYLAEKYGFSSHSKFAAIFKSVTDITPSVFIDNLKQDEGDS